MAHRFRCTKQDSQCLAEGRVKTSAAL
jgi:hypothetical protein